MGFAGRVKDSRHGRSKETSASTVLVIVKTPTHARRRTYEVSEE